MTRNREAQENIRIEKRIKPPYDKEIIVFLKGNIEN